MKFRKTLNIDNQLKEVQKLSDQFDDFVNEYVTRRDRLKKELYNKAILDLASWEAIQDIPPFNEVLE